MLHRILRDNFFFLRTVYYRIIINKVTICKRENYFNEQMPFISNMNPT